MPSSPMLWPATVSPAVQNKRSPSSYTHRAVQVAKRVEPAEGTLAPGVLPPRAESLDDAPVADALERGDEATLAAVYDAYAPAVFAVALRILNERPAAEDIVQETFLRLWRQPTAYQAKRGRLLTWLLAVAHHRAIDLVRRRRLEERYQWPGTNPAGDARTDGTDGIADPSAEGDPPAAAAAREGQGVVQRALAQLTADQRQLLELAYYSGLTQSQIADRLGEPLGTIKTRMRTGLLRLRAVPGVADLWRDGGAR